MFTRIRRQEALDLYPALPYREYDVQKDKELVHYPKIIASYVLALPSKTYKGHIRLLANQLTLMAKKLAYDNLIFLGDLSTPWLKRADTLDVFRNQLQYLADNKVGKRFNGAHHRTSGFYSTVGLACKNQWDFLQCAFY